MQCSEEVRDMAAMTAAENLPAKVGLQPLNWQDGNVVMSPTCFYMLYNDLKTGITVRFTNRLTNESSMLNGFDSIKAAQEWVKSDYLEAQDQPSVILEG